VWRFEKKDEAFQRNAWAWELGGVTSHLFDWLLLAPEPSADSDERDWMDMPGLARPCLISRYNCVTRALPVNDANYP